VFVADPSGRTLTIWHQTADGAYQPAEASSLLAVSAADLVAAIRWPDDTD
jgi:hypothetical protein